VVGDWSSDVCSSDLRPDIDADPDFQYWNTSPTRNYLGSWSEYGVLGTLFRSNRGAGTETVLSRSLDDYSAVRVDAHDIYFVRAHQILRMPK